MLTLACANTLRYIEQIFTISLFSYPFRNGLIGLRKLVH